LIRETKKTRSVGVPRGTGLGNTGLSDLRVSRLLKPVEIGLPALTS